MVLVKMRKTSKPSTLSEWLSITDGTIDSRFVLEEMTGKIILLIMTSVTPPKDKKSIAGIVILPSPVIKTEMWGSKRQLCSDSKAAMTAFRFAIVATRCWKAE